MLKRTNTEPWRDLHVGDFVRFVQMPSEVTAPGYRFPPMTRRLYKKLIEHKRPTRISSIDDCGRPCITYRFREKNGVLHRHILAVDDDSWVRVKHRKKLAKRRRTTDTEPRRPI
jgi:hypothetical protein